MVCMELKYYRRGEKKTMSDQSNQESKVETYPGLPEETNESLSGYTPRSELIDTVVAMIQKKLERQGEILGCPFIEEITIQQSGSVTLVLIEANGKKAMGWSKYNPKDDKKVYYWVKGGNYQKCFRKSNFDPTAGMYKALDRAINVLLDLKEQND